MPAIAQSQPALRWRCTSSFPKSVDAVFDAVTTFSKFVAEATDNRWQVQTFAPGEIVGPFQLADAVQNGTVEMGHTASYYFVGKDPTFAMGTALPFGPNSRQMNAWLYDGGGQDRLNAFYSKFNIFALPGGNTGAQMGGWFRKEVRSLEDMKGLKMRIPGIAGQVMTRLGAVPQQIPGGDVYPALERGAIDAAEWVGPYDDEKLGFYRVAPFYYYPGFWEGGPALHFFFNQDRWNELPASYKAIARAAASHANVEMQAKYDARNPAALKRLLAGGAQLRAFPRDVLEAAHAAAQTLYAEIAEKNEAFRTVYSHYSDFRDDQYLWWRVAEANYDGFMVNARAAR
jgi:TRAP-type mannitol/chloroaromatic compound transport system substrate-binding protein